MASSICFQVGRRTLYPDCRRVDGSIDPTIRISGAVFGPFFFATAVPPWPNAGAEQPARGQDGVLPTPVSRAGLLQRLVRPAASPVWPAPAFPVGPGRRVNRPGSVAPWSGGATCPCADGGAGGND